MGARSRARGSPGRTPHPTPPSPHQHGRETGCPPKPVWLGERGGSGGHGTQNVLPAVRRRSASACTSSSFPRASVAQAALNRT
ncbi:hypothetical protein COCON_G00092270 [Conger conger]|uniref:Uncharacterized protein n=1 Tax=Conger conger TaxID=82655 RepID=A0A9Q1DL86_CONCO|nr:hypothetical protein COCON_G00092270 [Conger conger]